MRRLWLALTLAVTVIPSAVVAQDDGILLERVRGEGDLLACQWWHMVNCDLIHFDGTEVTPAGTVVYLFDGKPYELLWKANAYYLDSGVAVFPEEGGTTDGRLAGQRWTAVRPAWGAQLVSQSWSDLDFDGRLGPGDRLVLAGGEERTVKDVRLNIRIRPLPSPR